MLHEATMTKVKNCKLQRGYHTSQYFFATCNSPAGNCLQLFLRQLEISCERKTLSDCLIFTKLLYKLRLACHTQQLVSQGCETVTDISTFLATRNATFCCRCRLQTWGVTREIFLATCLAMFVARQFARKIASCNMALRDERLF